ncbi:MAG: hypothetical protein IJ313_10510 [Clostridia bacterium]|nr:hypothetical protein [Clostridia bacterium]
MELKHYVEIAKEALDHIREKEWKGEGVIGVKITPVRAQDFEDAGEQEAVDAGEAPWEGVDELPEGKAVRPDEATSTMLDAMRCMEEVLERIADVIEENDFANGEMIAMTHEAGELARVMTRMHESVRAWQ